MVKRLLQVSRPHRGDVPIWSKNVYREISLLLGEWYNLANVGSLPCAGCQG